MCITSRALVPFLVFELIGLFFKSDILWYFIGNITLKKKEKVIQCLTSGLRWGSLRYSAPPLFFTACPNCVNDIWQKFPWAGSVARKVLASLYQSIWLMFPCLELPLDGNLLWASLANWNQISSTARCDIDPYSTPGQPIDQYWFTIKNTPLLVQHCDRYFKATGKKYLKRKKNGMSFFCRWPAGMYKNMRRCFISWERYEFKWPNLDHTSSQQPHPQWTMILNRHVRQTSKNGLMGWHLYKDPFIEGGVSVSELVAHLQWGVLKLSYQMYLKIEMRC